MDENRKPPAVRLMSLRAYARYRGIALYTVQAAIEAGRISVVRDERGRKRIDPARADIEFAENTDPSKQGRKAGTPEQPPPEPGGAPAAVAAAAAPPPPPPPAPATGPTGFAKARESRETFQAKLKELEYEQKAGHLVPVQAVKEEAFKLAKITRDALLAIPDRLAGLLAAETDPQKVHTLLQQELVRALEALTREDGSA